MVFLCFFWWVFTTNPALKYISKAKIWPSAGLGNRTAGLSSKLLTAAFLLVLYGVACKQIISSKHIHGIYNMVLWKRHLGQRCKSFYQFQARPITFLVCGTNLNFEKTKCLLYYMLPVGLAQLFFTQIYTFIFVNHKSIKCLMKICWMSGVQYIIMALHLTLSIVSNTLKIPIKQYDR